EENAQAEAVETQSAYQRELDRALEQIAGLLPDASVLERHDPRPELSAAREEHAQAVAAAQMHAEAAVNARAEAQTLTKRKEALLSLLSHAWLLDARDFRAEATELAARLEKAQSAEMELRRTAEARQIVQARIEVLRALPPSDDDLERMRTQKAEDERMRDNIARALMA